MPNKTITAFNYGYAYELTNVNSYINYGIYAYFNSASWSTGFGMVNPVAGIACSICFMIISEALC